MCHAMDHDFSLRSDGKAADAGQIIATANEDFHGMAPDLSALETGKPMPHYDPR